MKVTGKRGRLLFGLNEFHDRGGVEVGEIAQRSSSRCRESTSDRGISPAAIGSGSGRSRVARRNRRASSRRSIASPRGKGTRRARGRPRSVISSCSPAATRRSTALACCCNARMPTCSMCVNVVHHSGCAFIEASRAIADTSRRRLSSIHSVLSFAHKLARCCPTPAGLAQIEETIATP